MKVVIIGNGNMLANLIEGTLDSQNEIVGVMRYERTKLPTFAIPFYDFFNSSCEYTLIKEHKLYEIKCNSANTEKFKNELLRLNADVLLVGSWPEKLKKEVFDIPVVASVNVHPSFLPKYRGPNPYLQTILHNEKKSGLTFHLIDKNLDNGAILEQKEIDILPTDTSKELRERTVFQARQMCTDVLNKLENGLIIPVKQNEKLATYYPNIKPSDMMLDFEKESAEQIVARIKAFHPWLPCYVTYGKKYFIPNPYKLRIIDKEHTQKILDKNRIKEPKIGDIIDAHYKSRAIIVMCQNCQSIKMTDTRLYGLLNKIFTKLFIKNIKF